MHLPTLAEHEIIMTLVALALLLAGAYLLGTLFEPASSARSSAVSSSAGPSSHISSPGR